MNKEPKCRIADEHELMKLWNFSGSNTYHYFIEGIKRQNIEFWVLDLLGDIIGELYIFWDSPDKDEANGVDRAYLCAFRVDPRYQGNGYGSLLMNRVLKRLEQKKIKEVTIGVDNDDYERLSAMYAKWGFNQLVKTKTVDLHYIGKDGNPTPCDEYNLYCKK
jgi:ribosomal protein S18 acetylase RimI-like enzyme